jgi:hypothetical protein
MRSRYGEPCRLRRRRNRPHDFSLPPANADYFADTPLQFLRKIIGRCPNYSVVWHNIGMHVLEIIFVTSPNNRDVQPRSDTSFEIHAATVTGKVGNYKC